MNQAISPNSGLVEVLLFDVARRVQLPMSDYRLAIDRYQTMDRHLRRPESVLKDYIARLYPQGSMAIGAVISSKFENDEFDVDVFVELGCDPFVEPAAALDALELSIEGETGSRYHGKTTRNTRCVTVHYDSMHIDFTPGVRLVHTDERTSNIFHAKHNEPEEKHFHVVANPWGFADWFEANTPSAKAFAEAVLRKVSEPLPEPEALNEKSIPLLALQLLKRFRNKRYDDRKKIRKAPSVILAYYAALHAGSGQSLLAEMCSQARAMLAVFNAAHSQGQKVEVRNPRCWDDLLSDRWPETLAHQELFIRDLEFLLQQLELLASGPSVPRCQEILTELFGERAVRDVVENFTKRYGSAAHSKMLHHQLGTGAAALHASGLTSLATARRPSTPTRPNTHFGSDGEENS